MCDIEYLDLFDEVPYKYVKSIITSCKTMQDKIEVDIEVDIEDLKSEYEWMCKTKFTFPLYIESGCKMFEVIKEYNSSSATAMYIMENLDEDEV